MRRRIPVPQQVELCFDDILLVPAYSELDSRTSPSTKTRLGRDGIELESPLISSPMDSITGRDMLVAMDQVGGLGVLTRHISLPDDEELRVQVEEVEWAMEQGARHVGCAIGIRGDVVGKAGKLLEIGCSVICLDVAHGDHIGVYTAIENIVAELKPHYEFTLMAGNVCTAEAVSNFAFRGVDAIKVGIGPGAACTTRNITGFGRPQLAAIQQAREILSQDNNGASIIADGGLRTSGDMVKALWAGADACMIGYMIAGTNKTPRIDGKHVYRGMSSRAASDRPDIAPEGVEMETGDRGETVEVVSEYIKGIRSGLAMGGANDLSELRANVDYVLVSPLCMSETLPKTS